MGNMNNPAKFLADNFAKQIDMNGNLDAYLGLTVFGIGISTFPVASSAW